jgi:hypothetical protein
MSQNGEAPVTRVELRADLEQLSARLTERISDMETKLLRAFRQLSSAEDRTR